MILYLEFFGLSIRVKYNPTLLVANDIIFCLEIEICSTLKAIASVSALVSSAKRKIDGLIMLTENPKCV